MKTIKVINKQVAKELSIDEKEIDTVNSYFWKSFKIGLLDLSIPTYYVKEIGTFTISKYKLYKEIKSLVRRLKTLDDLPYKELTKETMRTHLLKTLKKCLSFRNYLAKQEYDNITRNKIISS